MTIKCAKCQSDNPDTLKFCGECGTQLTPAESGPEVTKTLETSVPKLNIGSAFANRYEIIKELGQGGMGRVYKALDTEINEEVAIKLIKPEIAADERTVERFRNELKFARKISHKNVCRMYHISKEEGTPYITMEYVPGEDLKGLIRKKEKLGEDEVISIAMQVCEGLSEAHGLGVVHRDLKPQNIMIDEKGNVKVMDFGIARSTEAPGVTQTGMIIGTPDYISPEQAEGGEADQRSDIYSLGAILYEMVTGSVPFEGDTALSVAIKHKTKMPADPRKLNPELSEKMSRLILVCMEKDKERRYQTAEALLSDLQNIEQGFPLGTTIRPRRATFASVLIRNKLFIPAVVVALAIIATAIWQLLPKKEAVPPASIKPSVAVLPFEDLSPQKDLGYLCDGVPQSLIVALHKIKDLRVPASTSSFKFRGREQDMQEIGEKLNVKTVLKGSLQKSGDRIGIIAQLINVEDESLLWSEQYNREMEDVFAIQDEINMAVVDKLKLELLGGEKEKLVKRYTGSTEAYNLYLKGKYFWNKRTGESIKKAFECFEKAIETDPDYALVYAELAHCYSLSGFYGYNSPKNVYPKAKAAIKKALELDDTLAEAHNYSGFISFVHDWDWISAEREFKRAIELNPGYAYAYHINAFYLRVMGRFDEALEAIKRAVELDPLSLTARCEWGFIHFHSGRLDEAIEQFNKTLEMDPNYGYTHGYIGMTYRNKGRYEEAIAAYQKGIELTGGSSFFMGFLGAAYVKSDHREKAIDLLRELEERSKKAHAIKTSIATIYAALGEIDKAFELLEEAYEERDPMLIHGLKGFPDFESIYSDPRYIALLKKIGLD